MHLPEGEAIGLGSGTEVSVASLTVDEGVLEEACQWVGEICDDEGRNTDILTVIHSLIQDAQKCKTACAIKSLMPLTALTHFIKLHTCYASNPKCRQPNIQASLTAAKRFGKGPYFAQKICELEPYVLKHHALPPSKTQAHKQHLSLLDNKSTLQGV